MKKGTQVIELACAALVFLWSWTCSPQSFAQERTVASITLSTFPSYGKNAPISYLAVKTSKDAKYRLQLSQTFQPSLLPILSGDAQIAQILYTDAVVAIERGDPLVIVGTRDFESPVSTVSLRSKKIQSPTDYVGKRWGHSAGYSPEMMLLKAIASKYDLDIGTIELKNLSFPLRWQSLLTGEIDFFSAWYGSGSVAISQNAAKLGIPVDFVQWRQFGANVYGEVFVVNKVWAGQNKDALKEFFRDLSNTYSSCLSQPDPCIEAVLKSGTMQIPDIELVREGWKQSGELLSKDTSRNLFTISPERMRASLAAMQMSLKTPDNDFYTNEYLNP